MINIVNKELFDFKDFIREADQGREKLHQLDIFTTPQATKFSSSNSKIVSNSRQLLRLSSQSENYKDYKHSISVRDNANNKRSVLIRANERVRRDANIFLVAFPFNGLVKPIEFSKQYRIYKGYIATSDSFNILFNNRKYKRVLYLIIEPNMNLFTEGHAFETSKIDIDIESVAYSKQGGETVSIKETLNISITADDYTTSMEREEVEPVDMSIYKGTQMYTQFEIKNRETSNKPVVETKNVERKPQNTSRPKQKPRITPSVNPPEVDRSIDRMMEKAGLFDVDDVPLRRSKKNNRKYKK